MSIFENSSLWIAGGALLVSIISVVISSKSNKTANEASQEVRRHNREMADFTRTQILVAYGELEQKIAESIENAKKDCVEAAKNFDQFKDDHKLTTEKKVKDLRDDLLKTYNRLQQLTNQAFESYLNAYDLACGHYLDNKVDKDRFRKNYASNIKALVERVPPEGQINYLHPRVGSKYGALWKVFDEFHSTER